VYKLAAAVVGTGFIGPVHVEALRRLGVAVVGVLGSSEAKSRQAAEQMGIPCAYGSLEELLADERVQVVHITSPNRLHFEQANNALRAGKHVLCEKPLAMDSGQSAALVELAEKTGLAAGVNYNVRFYPLCLEARDIVARGDLGDVYLACGSYVQDWLCYPSDYNWRVLADQGGELRAVADIGTHWLDLVTAITAQQVEAVCADLSTVHPVRQRPQAEVETFKGKESSGEVESETLSERVTVSTEDYGCVMLRFAGGARGCLWVSQVTAGRKNCLRFEIAGSKRALSWCSEQPNQLWIGHRDEANETLIRDPALLSASARAYAGYPGGHNEGFADTFKACFQAFYDSIEGKAPSDPAPYPTFEDGHREILLCEAILRSYREGRWIKL
jgi:predicted dehydrogenase